MNAHDAERVLRQTARALSSLAREPAELLRPAIVCMAGDLDRALGPDSGGPADPLPLETAYRRLQAAGLTSSLQPPASSLQPLVRVGPGGDFIRDWPFDGPDPAGEPFDGPHLEQPEGVAADG